MIWLFASVWEICFSVYSISRSGMSFYDRNILKLLSESLIKFLTNGSSRKPPKLSVCVTEFTLTYYYMYLKSQLRLFSTTKTINSTPRNVQTIGLEILVKKNRNLIHKIKFARFNESSESSLCHRNKQNIHNNFIVSMVYSLLSAVFICWYPPYVPHKHKHFLNIYQYFCFLVIWNGMIFAHRVRNSPTQNIPIGNKCEWNDLINLWMEWVVGGCQAVL